MVFGFFIFIFSLSSAFADDPNAIIQQLQELNGYNKTPNSCLGVKAKTIAEPLICSDPVKAVCENKPKVMSTQKVLEDVILRMPSPYGKTNYLELQDTQKAKLLSQHKKFCSKDLTSKTCLKIFASLDEVEENKRGFMFHFDKILNREFAKKGISLQEEIFGPAEKNLVKTLNEFPNSAQAKKEVLKMANGIQVNNGKLVREDKEFLDQIVKKCPTVNYTGAFMWSSYQRSELYLCPGNLVQLLADPDEEAVINAVAHEMGHAVDGDACYAGFHSSPRQSEAEYQKVKKQSPLGKNYSTFLGCMKSAHGVVTSMDKELVADQFAARLMAERLKKIDAKKRIDTLSKSYREHCNRKDTTDKVHPPGRVRIAQTLNDPKVRALFGCKTPAPQRYCDF